MEQFFDDVPTGAPPGVPLDDDPTTVERPTDLGNSRVFVRLHGRDVRWCPAMPGSGWMIWQGSRWVPDETRRTMQLAADVAVEWRNRADGDPKLLKHALRSESAGSIRALLDLACSHRDVATKKDAWDADLWLFNTPDYTYAPLSLTRYPPRRTDLITRQAAVSADPDGGCPVWLGFLRRVMGGDEEMVSFLQRAVGYCLTGSIQEQCLFIAYGRGANGKSTFMDTVSYLLGDYAVTTPVETFVGRREGAIPNDLAALAGARLVTCSESTEGAGLDEGLVKLATGGDPISARFLNREFFSFIPRFKLWMLTNHKPVIRGTDEGIWRRLRLIPFLQVIPPEERDGQLPTKLRKEAPAILQWAIEGLKEWRRVGLAPPAAVLEATAEYRAEMDILGDFLTDCCTLGENLQTGNAEVYAAHRGWCRDNGLKEWSHKRLSRALMDRGITQAQVRGDGRVWRGLALLAKPLPLVERIEKRERDTVVW